MLASSKLNSAESVPVDDSDHLIVMKLGFLASGIYIWEFVTTLDFEWSVIRHQRHRWTIWIYSVTRLSGLAVISLTLASIYNTSPINCQAWITFAWAFSVLGGYGLTSILIMLRIFVIWDKNKVIMTISAALWAISLGFQVLGIVKIRAEWTPAIRSCTVMNDEICRKLYNDLLITDVILLLIMHVGLWRLRRGTEGSYYLPLLWKQGVIWLAIAIAAEIPQVLFLFLNVNEALHMLFVVPSMVAIIIAATRMYRSLIHSISPSPPDMIHLDLPSNQLEVTAHNGSYPAQVTDNSHELGSDDNVEGRDEKQ